MVESIARSIERRIAEFRLAEVERALVGATAWNAWFDEVGSAEVRRVFEQFGEPMPYRFDLGRVLDGFPSKGTTE